jgi:ketosteroid isomerase-like protein
MSPAGARSPEELETLFEDALVLDDSAAVAALFDPSAVVITQDGSLEAHGRADIARAVVELWAGERGYLADARRVVQARNTALVVGDGAIHVVRRGRDRSWRYAISLLTEAPDTRRPT